MGRFPIIPLYFIIFRVFIPLYFIKKLYLCRKMACDCQEYEGDAYRCSLENFSILENQDVQDDNTVRRIAINSLYAISNLCK